MIPDTFEFLLVSTDYDLLKAVTAALKQFSGHLSCATSVETANGYVQRRKLDGIIVDTRVPEAAKFMSSVRDGYSNRFAAIFAVVESTTEAPKAVAAGANYTIPRPITVERMLAGFESAREAMARERRRYFRHEVLLPVSIVTPDGEYKVSMTNVSEGGMAVRATPQLPPRSVVEFRFEVPSTTPAAIQGKGEIAWASAEGGVGIRFHSFHGGSERYLQSWLLARERASS